MITDLSRWDMEKQKRFPTIMVPQRSELPACAVGQSRLLMAGDGLYLETKREWGGLVRKLWNCLRWHALPYGAVEERDEFVFVLHEKVMPIVSGLMVPEAARYAQQGKEWAGFVVWDGSDFAPWMEDFDATRLSVDFLTHGAANLPEGMSLVADIHSHGQLPPRFSRDDNASDKGRVKISIVLGNHRTEDGQPFFDWTARYCVEGFFFERATEEVFLIRNLGDRLFEDLGEEISDGEEETKI